MRKSGLCALWLISALAVSGCSTSSGLSPVALESISPKCKILVSSGKPVIKKFSTFSNAYGVGKDCPPQLPGQKIDIVRSSSADIRSNKATFTTIRNSKGIIQVVSVEVRGKNINVSARPK